MRIFTVTFWGWLHFSVGIERKDVDAYAATVWDFCGVVERCELNCGKPVVFIEHKYLILEGSK